MDCDGNCGGLFTCWGNLQEVKGLDQNLSFIIQVLPQLTLGSGHDLTLQFEWKDGLSIDNCTTIQNQNMSVSITTESLIENITTLV